MWRILLCRVPRVCILCHESMGDKRFGHRFLFCQQSSNELFWTSHLVLPTVIKWANSYMGSNDRWTSHLALPTVIIWANTYRFSMDGVYPTGKVLIVFANTHQMGEHLQVFSGWSLSNRRTPNCAKKLAPSDNTIKNFCSGTAGFWNMFGTLVFFNSCTSIL